LSVRPSVCPSVAYIANNSRNQRPIAYPNLERRFSTLDATCIPVSRSNGQRSGSPGPLMLTHIVRHSFRMPRATNSNVVYGWRTTTRISYRRHDLQGQRSRSQGHVISLSRLAQCWTRVIRCGRGYTVSAEPSGTRLVLAAAYTF